MTIKRATGDAAGGFRADVTYGGKTAHIVYDEAVVGENRSSMKIQNLGYDATTVGDVTHREATAQTRKGETKWKRETSRRLTTAGRAKREAAKF